MTDTSQLAFPRPSHVRKKPRPMKRVNRRRAAKTYAKNFGERGAAVREMPCLLAGTGTCEDQVEAAPCS